MVLDRDDGVLQIGGDAGERHVAPLLVEPEPRLAVGRVEHRVADAPAQAADRDGVPAEPPDGDGRARQQAEDQCEREPFPTVRRTPQQTPHNYRLS